MLRANCLKYVRCFKEPSGTSRGILTRKETWFIKIFDSASPEIYGIGECAVFRGLSADDRPDYEEKLEEVCRNIHLLGSNPEQLKDWSSIRFGVETALADLRNGGNKIIYPSEFTNGKEAIEINGLIWMGDKEKMWERITEKLDAGFRCVKLKIGAIDFDSEVALLKTIRARFNKKEIELRVDANGAFTPAEALEKLKRLERFDLHSIEQPIRSGQWQEMARLCVETPVPIALDEELIGVNDILRKIELLDRIKPHYIILKPSLAGGFSGSAEWIELARQREIGWWITSALESNVGLNAIAQWAYTLKNHMPQGLGTGELYTNNIFSPLNCKGASLYYDPSRKWEQLKWKE